MPMKPVRNRSRKWIWLLAAFIVITGLGAAGYMNRQALAMWGFDLLLSHRVEQKLESSYKPLRKRLTAYEQPFGSSSNMRVKSLLENASPIEEEAAEDKPFTLLLLGIDQRALENARSDTMIYTVVRPADGMVLMISIPRDTYAEIAGKKAKSGEAWEDKITHAYAFGKEQMAVESVEKLLGTHVDHYATINFEGFRDCIDAMDGIALPITKDMVNDDPDHEKFTIKAGQDIYNGRDALNYVRFREDAGGDTSRTQRQQIFLGAMMEKAAGIGQWRKIPDMVDIMGRNFSTDLKPAHMIGLAKGMLQQETGIYSHTLRGEGHRKGRRGAWYYFADENDLRQIRSWIDDWLNPAKPKEELPLPDSYAVCATAEPGRKKAGSEHEHGCK